MTHSDNLSSLFLTKRIGVSADEIDSWINLLGRLSEINFQSVSGSIYERLYSGINNGAPKVSKANS